MTAVILVDHPLPAEAFRGWLAQRGVKAVRAAVDELADLEVPGAVVLIELFLPGERSGLQLARALHTHRTDLIPVVWTRAPELLYLWAAQ